MLSFPNGWLILQPTSFNSSFSPPLIWNTILIKCHISIQLGQVCCINSACLISMLILGCFHYCIFYIFVYLRGLPLSVAQIVDPTLKVRWGHRFLWHWIYRLIWWKACIYTIESFYPKIKWYWFFKFSFVSLSEVLYSFSYSNYVLIIKVSWDVLYFLFQL